MSFVAVIAGTKVPAYQVQGLLPGTQVQGSGFEVQGSGFEVQGSRFKVQGKAKAYGTHRRSRHDYAGH
jgi:hypothetical protein